jgi:hypothetical protein
MKDDGDDDELSGISSVCDLGQPQQHHPEGMGSVDAPAAAVDDCGNDEVDKVSGAADDGGGGGGGAEGVKGNVGCGGG